MRQKLIELQRGIDESTITVRDINTPLSKMDRYKSQNISKDIVELNRIINQLNINDMYTHYFFQQQQSTHYSQSHMEQSPK